MLLAVLIGCAHVGLPGPLSGMGGEPLPYAVEGPDEAPAPRAPRTARRRGGQGDAVAEAALGFLGASSLVVGGERYRWDCSGFVEASLASAGCVYRGSSADLFAQAKDLGVLHRRRKPSPGDVAFFDDTYDRNRNGRADDPLSHVAVVESVDADGTIHMVHVGSKGVVPLVMNLRRPEERVDDDGKVLNDILRARTRGDGPRTRTLTGELWVGFGSFWKAPPSVAEDED